MICFMSSRFSAALSLMVAALWIASCGSSRETPVLVGDVRAAAAEGEELYQRAKAADEAGKARRAIKLYDQAATRFPFAASSPQARYRQAELLEQAGRPQDAFDAYDKFLQQYPGNPRYSSAFNRLVSISQDAAEGDIKSSFLGLKTRLSLDKTVDMLSRVKGHAPMSATAAKAQFAIGELYQSRKKSREAIEAFRELVREQPGSREAPEALFRVGVIYLEEAERGNQSQSNLDLARESFNDYLIQYSGHARNAEARRMISTLDGMDLDRSFEIAEFYMRTGRPESAKIYYRDIVRKSRSGEIHDAARARLRELGE